MLKACWDDAGGTKKFRPADGVFVYQLCVGHTLFFLQPYGIGQMDTTHTLNGNKEPGAKIKEIIDVLR